MSAAAGWAARVGGTGIVVTTHGWSAANARPVIADFAAIAHVAVATGNRIIVVETSGLSVAAVSRADVVVVAIYRDPGAHTGSAFISVCTCTPVAAGGGIIRVLTAVRWQAGIVSTGIRIRAVQWCSGLARSAGAVLAAVAVVPITARQGVVGMRASDR